MAHDVFVSYASQNKPAADAVCAALEAANIRCWVAPRDVAPGVTWPAAILSAIQNCHAMVLVFTSDANASREVLKEVTLAGKYAKPILPFRIERVDPSGDMEYHLSTPHWLDAMTPPMEAHIQRLVESVGRLVGQPVREAPPAIRPLELRREPPPIPATSKYLAILALALHGVSWVIPAATGQDTMLGYQAYLFAVKALPSVITGLFARDQSSGPFDVVAILSPHTNYLFWAAALFVLQGRTVLRRKAVSVALFLSFFCNLVWLVMFRSHLLAGYYLWLGSFLLLGCATVLAYRNQTKLET